MKNIQLTIKDEFKNKNYQSKYQLITKELLIFLNQQILFILKICFHYIIQIQRYIMSKKVSSKIKLYTLPNEPSIAQQFAFKSICEENDTLRLNCLSPTFPSDSLSLFTQNMSNKLTTKEVKQNMSATNVTKRNTLKQTELKAQIDKLSEHTKTLQKENKKLKGKIKSYKQIDNMKILDKFKNSSEFQNVDLFLELQEMSSLFQKSQNKLQKVEAQNSEYLKKITALQEQSKNIQKQKIQNKSDKQINVKLQQLQKQCKDKVQNLQNEKQTLKRQNQLLKDNKKEAQQKFSQLKLLHQQVKKKLTNHNKQYKDLQEKLKKTEQSTGESLRQKAQLIKQNQLIKSEHKKNFMELQQSKQQIFQMAKTINRLQMLNKQAQEKIQELNELREMNFITEKQKNQLKKNLDKSEKQVQKLLSQIESKATKIENLNKNIEYIEEKYQQQVISLKGEIKKINSIKQDYQILFNDSKSKQLLNQELNEKIVKLSSQNNTLKEENIKLSQNNQNLIKQLSAKDEEVQQTRLEIERLKRQLKKYEYTQIQEFRLKRQRPSLSKKSIDKIKDIVGLITQYVPSIQTNYLSNKAKHRQDDQQSLIFQLVILVKSLIRYSENIKGQAELIQLKYNTIQNQNEQEEEEFEEKVKLKEQVIVKLVKLTPNQLKQSVIDYLYLTDKLAEDPTQQICQQRQQIGNKLEIEIQRWSDNVNQLRNKMIQYEQEIYELKRLLKGKNSKFSIQADLGKKDIMKKYGVLSNKQ